MTRARAAVALSTALLLALSGCGKDAAPAAAPTSAAPAASSAAPATSAAVDDRATCRKNADTGNAFEFDPATNLAHGQLAVQSSQPGISAAGGKLVAAATASPVVNVDIAQAQLDLAEACAAVFGDGPW
ncbi:hypothetical protein COO58_17560 [Micromonospora sp. WMMA1996]|uniref:hypothetical protein n=1 Tax=Micromonospora sp. WMMA1996 TaxID=2039878 RepID=UPI000BF31822|nr:hypothetical protein [Micromonospora sp. WMMA1996]PGH46016.1 hypothetical protein COO58_17560 [Micromonospora sp. WMMA1996]